MNVLVTYASKHGSTKEIAERLRLELRSAGLSATLRPINQFTDLGRYDALVLGCAVYAGSWLPEVGRFIDRQREALSGLPVWVFSSGPLGAGDPHPHDDPERLAAPLAGLPLRGHRIFGGRLDKRALGPGERFVARIVWAPEGDFRNWDEVRGYALEIAAALLAPGAPAQHHLERDEHPQRSDTRPL